MDGDGAGRREDLLVTALSSTRRELCCMPSPDESDELRASGSSLFERTIATLWGQLDHGCGTYTCDQVAMFRV